MLIYSLFSSPTPKYFSIIEFGIVFFFILSLDLRCTNFKFLFSKKNLYLFTFSIIVIFFNFNNSNQFYRDLVAVSYLLIPFIFLFFFKKEYYRILPITLCIAGLVLFYRILIDNYKYQYGLIYIYKDNKYLINDSLIQYSIIFLTLYSILYLKKSIRIIFILFSITSFCIFINLSLSASNKTFLVGFFYVTIIILIYLIKQYNKNNKIKYQKNLFRLFLITFLLSSFFLYNYRIDFTLLLNSRDLEYQFFYNFIKDSSLIEKLFGKGLGSYFLISWDLNNPQLVGYNHSFVIYILYKLGLVGFFLVFAYLNRFFCFVNFNLKFFFNILILKKNNIVFHSSFITLIFSFFYTTNYKTFSIWLIVGILILELKKLKNETN